MAAAAAEKFDTVLLTKKIIPYGAAFLQLENFRHDLSCSLSGKSLFAGGTVIVIAQNTDRRTHRKKRRKNMKTKNSLFAAVDPGYLMVAVYIFSVVALMLFGWFGAAGASGEAAAEPPAIISLIQQEQQHGAAAQR
jgi:hypothetical protein